MKYVFTVYLLLLLAATFVPYGQALEHVGRINDLYFRVDYLVHALVFMALIPLWARALPGWKLWMIVVAALLLALAAEGVHYFLAYRSYNPCDMLANAAGVLMGTLLTRFLSPTTP